MHVWSHCAAVRSFVLVLQVRGWHELLTAYLVVRGWGDTCINAM